MAKYKLDWNEVENDEAPILIAAVVRYMSVEEYPNPEHIAAILAIKKEEER